MTPPNKDDYKELWAKAEQRGGGLELPTENIKDLLHEEFPPETWIVDELIPDGSVTIMSGSPGSFKTWLYMDIAVKVAQGKQALGNFNTKQTGVLIIDEESGKQRLQRRFKQLGATDETQIDYVSRRGYKMHPIYEDAIARTAEELGAGLIVFDSFTRFSKGDENTTKDMSVVMDYYRQLADKGFAVLILHHNRKEMAGQYNNPAQSMRGSSDILAAADCHIAVSRKGQSEFVTLTQTKNRDVWEPVPFELRFQNNASEFQYVGAAKTKQQKHDELTQQVVEAIESSAGQSQRQLTIQLMEDGFEAGERKVKQILAELIAANVVEVRKGSRNSHEYYLLDSESALKTQ